MLAPDRFSPLLAFCLLTQAVQHLPLEREAPLGGLETLPVKRIREANLNPRCSNLSQSIRSTSASCPHSWIQSLISSKVMMNQFQRTDSLTYRKFCIFESALIHRRTHKQLLTKGVANRGWCCKFGAVRLASASLSGDKDADPELPHWPHPQPLAPIAGWVGVLPTGSGPWKGKTPPRCLQGGMGNVALRLRLLVPLLLLEICKSGSWTHRKHAQRTPAMNFLRPAPWFKRTPARRLNHG